MKIAILKEIIPHETRVACTPDIAQKYIALGIDVVVETGAGAMSSASDASYQEKGVKIAPDAASAIKGADVVLKINVPTMDEVKNFQPDQILICHLRALTSPDIVKSLNERKICAIALELMPRITRAQSMDILSSQSNIAGYKAVLDACEYYGRVMPMMMTAAGTVPPAKVFVMGVGVAGLQAIATAKRLGAVVSATDVRPATKEQVESLNASFIAVENEEFLSAQTAGGYAKEMSDDYKKQQAALISDTIKKQDIVITTALIPGRPAPKLVGGDMVKSMKPGSVIVDLAVEAGGNVEFAKYGEVVDINGVKIIGHANYPARVGETTSILFAKNIYTFISQFMDDNKNISLNEQDEIIQAVMVTKDGNILNDMIK